MTFIYILHLYDKNQAQTIIESKSIGISPLLIAITVSRYLVSSSNRLMASNYKNDKNENRKNTSLFLQESIANWAAFSPISGRWVKTSAIYIKL